jgi:beta-galactosidase
MKQRFAWLVILAAVATWTAAVPAHAEAARQVISLDGTWDIEQGGMDAAPVEFTHKIAVPSLADMAQPAFSEVGSQSGQRQAFWYRRTFKVDGAVPAVALVKVAKATFGSRVILNGKLLGDHMPCFTPGYFDAQAVLKTGENEIVIRIGADPKALPANQPWGSDEEKRRYPPGIFDSVELILSGTPHIQRVQAVPDIEKKTVTIHVWVKDAKTPAATQLHFTVREVSTGKVVGEGDCAIAEGPGPERKGEATVAIQDCRLWSPEDPFLYEIEAKGEADVLKDRFGMRSFRLDGATGRAMLNGKPYFLRGSNVTLYRFFEDPDRGDKPWREEWVRRLFKAYRDFHWNALRNSISFPPEAWYRIADEQGMLIQDEFPIWEMHGAGYTADGLTQEYTEWMQERWNHPCVVIWDACNETAIPATAEAIKNVRGLDFSNRPWDNGWAEPVASNDCIEAHNYHFKDKNFELKFLADVPKGPKSAKEIKFKATGQHAVILNEYGWLWLNRDGSPTTLTAELYNNLGIPGAIRQKTYAQYLAAETEFWRCHRKCAGVLEFCGLGYSRGDGQTSDHWADLEKLTWEPNFLEYCRDAFAPVGLTIYAYAPTYPAGVSNTFPVITINDLNEDWKGTVQFRIVKDGKTVTEKSEPCEIPALGTKKFSIIIEIPKDAGQYEAEAALVKDGATDRVRSRREFKVQ